MPKKIKSERDKKIMEIAKAKKVKTPKDAINILDKRTKQICKQHTGGIKDRHGILIPDGVSNEIMDIVFKGEIIGDAEVGSDGFIEIMFVLGGTFVKIKREQDKVYLFLF